MISNKQSKCLMILKRKDIKVHPLSVKLKKGKCQIKTFILFHTHFNKTYLIRILNGKYLLTYQWSIQKQRHSDQCSYTESQDERSPSAPFQSTAVTGRADQRGEYEAEDWTEEPRQTVVLLWKTWTHRQMDISYRQVCRQVEWVFITSVGSLRIFGAHFKSCWEMK